MAPRRKVPSGRSAKRSKFLGSDWFDENPAFHRPYQYTIAKAGALHIQHADAGTAAVREEKLVNTPLVLVTANEIGN